MLKEACGVEMDLFGRLFKPRRDLLDNPPAGPPLGGGQNLPPPFVIDPPLESEGRLPHGGRLSFNFVALGPTVSRIEMVAQSFARLGTVGLENRTRHAHYRLLDIRDLLGGGRSLYADNLLCQPIVRDVARLVASMLPLVTPDEMLVSFTTPVRIMRQKFPPLDAVVQTADEHAVLQNQSPRKGLEPHLRTPRGIRDFYDFILVLVDRIGGLWQIYGDEWPGKEEFRQWRDGLLQASRHVKLDHLALEKRTYLRYSATQDRHLPIEGFTGTMRLHGDLMTFMELLLIGELVHLGEATAYGFGQYKLTY